MKKPILYGVLGVVVLVVAAAAAAPKVIGNGVREATMNSVVNLLPPESRSQLLITENYFNSGWFSSQGELDIRYAFLAEQEDLAVKVLFDISHGPLLLTPDGMRLGLAYAEITPSFNSPELTQALTELSVDLPDMRIDMIADLDQSLLMTFNMDPFNFSDADGQVSFAGMNGSLLANPDMSAELQFSMGMLSALQPATQMGFTMAGLNLQSNSQQMNDMLAPNMAMLAIPAISSEAPFAFNVSNINVSSQLQPSPAGPGQIDINWGFRVGSIETDFPLSSFNWTFNINEIHGDLIRSYYQMIAEIQNAVNNTPPAGTNPAEDYAEEIVTLAIQNSLVFSNLVEANAFEGDHSVEFRVDWRGLPGVTDLESIEAMQILEVLSFDVSVSLDEAAIRQSPLAEMVDPYVQQGYLRVENGRILMDVSLSDTELTVNGETVGLEQFL